MTFVIFIVFFLNVYIALMTCNALLKPDLFKKDINPLTALGVLFYCLFFQTRFSNSHKLGKIVKSQLIL